MCRFKLIVLVAVLLCAPVLSFAQSQLGTGQVAGTVMDAQGGAVPDATVSATNEATGVTRQVTTSAAGVFTIPVLPVGSYTVKVEREGFATQERKNVIVAVGSSATLAVTLQVGNIRQVVTVTETAPPIDTAKTESSSLVNRTQLADLPLNGRRYDQFALLTPGVTRDGTFGLLSYHGQSGMFNNFMIEGNDNNIHFWSEAAGRTRISMSISEDAIQEFQVASSNFLAELGGAAGGAINTVVRSGGNALHGDAYYYFRNQNWEARDPYARFKPPEQRQQFGGSVGGPIKHDRAFWFVNYEQQRRNFPLAVSARPDLTSLTTCETAKISGITAAQEAAACQAAINDLTSRFPSLASGFIVPRTPDQWLFLTKEDIQLSQKHTLSVSFNNLHWHSPNGIQTGAVLSSLGNNGNDDVRLPFVNVRLTSSLSPRTVNEFRWEWFRDWEFENTSDQPPNVFMLSSPKGGLGNFSYGEATFLQRPAFPDERHLQFLDNFTLISGAHTWKFGGSFNRVTEINNNPRLFGGQYFYANEAEYGLDLLPGTTGQNYSNFTQNFGLPGLTFYMKYYSGFGQDQWKLGRRLTLNYGLRWDYQQLPPVVAPNPALPQTQSLNSHTKDFGPRIGVAWDLMGNGKTLVRGGYGTFYGFTPGGEIFNALTQTGLSDPTLNTISITFVPGSTPGAPTFPNLATLPANITALGSVFLMDPAWRNPRVQEVNAGIERQISPTMTLSATYVYTRGDKLPISFDVNLPAPNFTRTYQLPDGSILSFPFSAGVTKTTAGKSQNINLSRPNPNFGALNEQRPLSLSWYNALLVEFRRRPVHGVQFQVSYTLSRNTNLVGTSQSCSVGCAADSPFGGSNALNEFNLKGENGPSTLEQRHRLVGNVVWELPFGKGGHGLGSALIRNYTASAIYQVQSGHPYPTGVGFANVPFSTPDGAQWNGFGGLLGQNGENLLLPRNNHVSSETNWLDFRFGRRFHLSERVVFSVMGEGFNVFNTLNATSFLTTAFSMQKTTPTTPLATPVVLTPNSTFGRDNGDGLPPDGTIARRLQIVGRLEF